ncbi:MAG: hypothetical protein J6T94_06190 [Bacteroidaceae bacterium]|nr:hypothetical protein [Bacteroidaceae bacterium]
MDSGTIIDNYLSKPYWIIDILPCRVPEGSGEQYFQIEKYLLSPRLYASICRRFAGMLLKLNCYEDIAICSLGSEWFLNPEPELLVKRVNERKPLFVWLQSTNGMISIDGDSHYMTLYLSSEDCSQHTSRYPLLESAALAIHPADYDERLQLLRALAVSEGLFVWKPQ